MVGYLSIKSCFKALQFDFNNGKIRVVQSVKDTYKICLTVLPTIETSPLTTEKWLDTSETFYIRAHFPNCLGSISEKHIGIKIHKTWVYIFFLTTKSIILAVIDSNLSYACIDLGTFGRDSNSNVSKQCPYGKKLYTNQLNIPEPKCLPNTDDCSVLGPCCRWSFLSSQKFTKTLSRPIHFKIKKNNRMSIWLTFK
jgi:hypothetical protein